MLEEEIKRSDNRSVCLARGELRWRHGPINQVERQVVDGEVAKSQLLIEQSVTHLRSYQVEGQVVERGRGDHPPHHLGQDQNMSFEQS